MSSKSPQQRLSADVAHAVYQKTSRRGLLAKASGLLMGLGVGSAVTAAPAAADAAGCCTGTNCKSLGIACPGISQCPPGWTWTNYTWVCCTGGRKVYCSDCSNNVRTCVCTYKTKEPCTATLTATEIAASAAS